MRFSQILKLLYFLIFVRKQCMPNQNDCLLLYHFNIIKVFITKYTRKDKNYILGNPNYSKLHTRTVYKTEYI